MNPRYRGLVVGLVQILLVASLGGVLLTDRARHPRVWVETAPFDPDLPFRGRYVRLALVIEGRGFDTHDDDQFWLPSVLSVEDGRLVARPREGRGRHEATRIVDGTMTLSEPVAFFIPEHVPDPSDRPAGETLWVEVTVPPKGPPRPIRLGVLRDGASGQPRPLDLHAQ